MKTELKNTIMQSLLMAATLAAALPFPELAWAQNDNLANSVTVVHGGLSAMPNIIAGAFYIGGAAMIGAGSLKLKAHSENPTNTPLGHGLGRIGAGAALIALPAFGTWLNSTLGIGTTAASAQGFGTIN
jgi:hypothetical protein